jgi:UDP-glucose 4-epimerase
MNILVTGGAGYIGSTTVKRLLENGHTITVFDNLVYGHEDAVNCELIKGNLEDKEFLFTSLAGKKFDAVVHFAAYAQAGESVQNPYKYFYSNITGGLNLLEYMVKEEIKYIIFSSTCAIFGTPDPLPVTEKSTKHPESPYGESKLMFEKILEWYDKIHAIKHINLRYFNAAGAGLDGDLGERHEPETHIIPIAIEVARGKREKFSLFGTDYPTKDGTCIRDYIHIEDLAIGHIQALEYIMNENKSDSFNLGTGNGYSNREVIDMVKKVSGVDFTVEENEKRAGDPPMIYADNTKARETLGFIPKYSDLQTIVESAWKWHEKH